MEEKLGAILADPQMMQQIMSLAQSIGQNPTPPPKPQPSPAPSPQPSGLPFGEGDLAMIRKLSSFAGKSNIDRGPQTLLKALGPYLTKDRISKLEKAMRAAKIAKFTTIALKQGAPALGSGR